MGVAVVEGKIIVANGKVFMNACNAPIRQNLHCDSLILNIQ